MAFEKARTALAQLEEKLRRQLGLAGDIGAQFEPKLMPVLIAGDLRDAGNAANQGRAFAWSFAGPLGLGIGAGLFQSVRTEADIFVDVLHISVAAAGVVTCYLTAPGVTPAVAVVTLAGTWTDRKVIAADQVPLTQGVAGAITGTADSDQRRIAALNSGGTGGAHVVFPVNIMLPAGSHLNWSNGPAGTVIGFSGRIWP